jgi:hypothetical protein
MSKWWVVGGWISGSTLVAAMHHTASCQSVVRGRVMTASAAPVANAEIGIARETRTARADALGRFEISGLNAGNITLVIRAVGFRPDSARITLGTADTIAHDFHLTPATGAQPLAALDIVAAGTGSRIPGFDDRRRAGVGRFIDRDALEKWSTRRTSELLATIPGMVVKYSAGKATVATTRGTSTDKCAFCRSRIEDLLDKADLAAGAVPACYMDIYLDGSLVYSYARTPPQALFSVNELLPESIEGIEVYTSASQIPAAYNRTSSGCGVLLIWSRRSA